ncbi:MAG: response regulator, partial [Coprobacillaceae bacterium]
MGKWGGSMSLHVLVVDDNKEIREIIQVLLSSEGYEIDEAQDGAEAIQ